MKKKLLTLVVPLAILLISGCKVDNTPSFKETWNLVSIGNTKDSAIVMLGKPTSVETTENPLITSERLDWLVDGQTYTLQIYWGRIATKQVGVGSESCILKTKCL